MCAAGGADYAGQQAWDAGRPDEALAQWRAAADAGDRQAIAAGAPCASYRDGGFLEAFPGGVDRLAAVQLQRFTQRHFEGFQQRPFVRSWQFTPGTSATQPIHQEPDRFIPAVNPSFIVIRPRFDCHGNPGRTPATPQSLRDVPHPATMRNLLHTEVRAKRVNPDGPAPAIPGGSTAGIPSAPCHREPRHG